MRRIGVLLPLLLLPPAAPGCGGKTPEPAPVRAVRMGMTPAEVSEAAGPPDRQTLLHPTPDTLEIVWSYKRGRCLRVETPEGARDFPRGCILTFGKDGTRLTGVVDPEDPPGHAAPPRPLPPVPSPSDTLPPAEAARLCQAILEAPPEALQPALDRVMVHFGDCLPHLLKALDGPDAPLPEDFRAFLSAPPGEPAERLRRVRPRTRVQLLLQLLNQGTRRHFGTPETPEETAAVAARWKAWDADGRP